MNIILPTLVRFNYNQLMRLLKKRSLLPASNVLIFLGIVVLVMAFFPLVKDEFWYLLKEVKRQRYVVKEDGSVTAGVEDSVFSRFLTSKPILLDPVSDDFSIIIEKIGVNAPVVRDISVSDEEAYMEALKHGVAHAISSDYPTEAPSNVYLFAHASLNFFKLGRYATVFNLLRKLNYGDRVIVFYDQKEYIYEVINKEVVKGWDVSPLTRSTIEPLLTLQTCDPPGTTLNRFVVTSKLIEVK